MTRPHLPLRESRRFDFRKTSQFLSLTFNEMAFVQVRHPNVLSFLHSTETETIEGGSTKLTIYVVTEPVSPLADKIKELNLKGTQRYHHLNFLTS